VVDAALEAFDGTGRPYLHISGLWVYGHNTDVTERSTFDPPAMVAWKVPIERRLLDATGLRPPRSLTSSACSFMLAA
jgi:hypothetical protein